MKISSETAAKFEEIDPSTDEVISRVTCDYINLSDRFLNCTKDFSKQYAHIYAARLSASRESLLKRINLKWGDKYQVKKIHELKEEKEETCILIGTLFKHQDLKPTILRELSDELEIIPQPSRTNFVEDDDFLILEDELQKIRLGGDVIEVSKIVTGIVCAVLGYEEGDGSFHVTECCWINCLPQKSLKMEDDKYIAIVSGLNFSSIKNNLFAIQLFAYWLCGIVGGQKERVEVSKVVRLIIAGNSISGIPSDSLKRDNVISTISTNISGPGYDLLDAVQKLDSLLDLLCQNIAVDIMPGEFDPTNIMLPQKPMHYCMFPKSLENNSFNGVTNPYECDIGGRIVSGSSGQPIADVLRYSSQSSYLEALRSTLSWGHIAPTAPDTLPCIPSHNADPFIFDNCPDVYFVGNADNYETELYEGNEGQKVRLVCVPPFSTSHTIALVNLRTLECHPMSFMEEFVNKMEIKS